MLSTGVGINKLTPNLSIRLNTCWHIFTSHAAISISGKRLRLCFHPCWLVFLSMGNFQDSFWATFWAKPSPFFIKLSAADVCPDSKVHGTNMGPTWVLSAPDGPYVGPMNLAIRVFFRSGSCWLVMILYADEVNLFNWTGVGEKKMLISLPFFFFTFAGVDVVKQSAAYILLFVCTCVNYFWLNIWFEFLLFFADDSLSLPHALTTWAGTQATTREGTVAKYQKRVNKYCNQHCSCRLDLWVVLWDILLVEWDLTYVLYSSGLLPNVQGSFICNIRSDTCTLLWRSLWFYIQMPIRDSKG